MTHVWEDIPPAYSSSTISGNPIRLVAPYLSASDLCIASRVNRAWSEECRARLFANPASHYLNDNASTAIYHALSRFLHSSSRASYATRQLIHTLYLPLAPAAQYGNPQSTWLVTILSRVPLKSLILRGIQFLDHAALSQLGTAQRSVGDNINGSLQPYSLLLLDASYCENVTSGGLVHALSTLPNLIYLDLSHTSAARDHGVLRQLSGSKRLKILRLRRVSLRDEDLSVLATAVGLRLRSLDLSLNKLGDDAAVVLVEKCLSLCKPPGAQSTLANGLGEGSMHWNQLEHRTLKKYQGDDFEHHVRRNLVSPPLHQLVFEPGELGSEAGISHLRIADTNLTADGISQLLGSARLHVLDVRHKNNALKDARNTGRVSARTTVARAVSESSSDLTCFKADYQDVFGRVSSLANFEQQAGELLSGPERCHDLRRLPPSYESIVPTANRRIWRTTAEAQPVINTDKVPDSRRIHYETLNTSLYHTAFTSRLQTLQLSNFPSHSPNPSTVESLITFIMQCATQANLARIASASSISLNAGQCMSSRQRRDQARLAAEEVFALERIVLEVVDTGRQQPRPWPRTRIGARGGAWLDRSRSGAAAAVTGDFDGDSMWAAADKDFSFFDEEEEEKEDEDGCGATGLIDGSVHGKGDDKTQSSVSVDNIAMLSAFRSSKKAEFIRRSAEEGPDVAVEGHWPGLVTVIRSSSKGEVEDQDCELKLGYYRLMYGR